MDPVAFTMGQCQQHWQDSCHGPEALAMEMEP